MNKPIIIYILLLFSTSPLRAQSIPPGTIPVLKVERTKEKITPDGALNEAAWLNADQVSDFWQQFPLDSLKAQKQTEIRMLFDDQFLYVAIKCYSESESYIIPSLKRDYDFSSNDNITLLLDTYNDKTNAFVFGLNPYGVQREALISGGGRGFNDFDDSWDNKWFGDSKIEEGYWAAEFAIPFSTLRFQEGGTQWRFNCYRSNTQANEWSTLNHIPRNNLIMDLTFMGIMEWEEPLQKTGSNISLIPYATAGVARDYEDDNQNGGDFTGNIGGDAKIAVTSGLNLDLTFNPDFSQVEVDQQVTDLSRFEVFFPERRQFFIENADLFSSYGLSRVNPFFSRRIGIGIDTTTGQNVQNTILYGARLSGKLNERLRVGLLNMQDAKQKDSGLPGFNYTVASLQQQVFGRSNLSLIFVNKQAINSDDFNGDFNRYNRVAGLEYRLATENNRWSGKAFYHQAFTQNNADHKFTQGLQVEYLRRKYRWEWAQLFVGNGYEAELGFVPRKDYLLLSPEAGLFFYPDKEKLNQIDLNVDTRFFFQVGKDTVDVVPGIVPDFGLSERQIELEARFQYANRTSVTLVVMDDNLTLLRDFDPTRLQADSISLKAGSKFHFTSVAAAYSSDERKKFSYAISPVVGQFYNGFRAGLGGSLTYRFQPYGFVSIDYDYNYIELNKPFKPVNIWLIGPRIDLTFSKKVFFTTFFQYNNQRNNLNINARFQWRFQPVSDLFLVYTDNYLTDPFSQFSVRNRTLVAKVTYWLNL